MPQQGPNLIRAQFSCPPLTAVIREETPASKLFPRFPERRRAECQDAGSRGCELRRQQRTDVWSAELPGLKHPLLCFPVMWPQVLLISFLTYKMGAIVIRPHGVIESSV